ncbi:hypothetical protein ACLOJK_014874 [Asimina triloba]
MGVVQLFNLGQPAAASSRPALPRPFPCSPRPSSPFISPALPCRPPFHLPSLLRSSSLPSPFHLPSRHSGRLETLPCRLPSPVSRLPSLSPFPGHLPSPFSFSVGTSRLRLRFFSFPVAPPPLILPNRHSYCRDLVQCCRDRQIWFPAIDMLSTVEYMFEYVLEYVVDRSGSSHIDPVGSIPREQP